jgi:hypothetical protein
LDYSSTNKHIYSFVALSWICILAIPIQIVAYLQCRLQCISESDTSLYSEPSAADRSGALKCYIVCFYSAFLGSLPFYLSNLLAGIGYRIPYEAFFTFYLLLYSSWNIPLVMWKCEGSCDSVCQVISCCERTKKDASSFRMTTSVLAFDHSSSDSNSGGSVAGSPRETYLLISTTQETQVQSDETVL